MARKANIAREEIHQACWDLLEQNLFPNIPRVAEYFLNKDGRHGSNTTLMNAISEWEESYHEFQQHKLKELDDSLAPVFNHFSREVTQVLGKLLDEKLLDLEKQQQLREDAAKGGYQSLSESLITLQNQFEQLEEDKLALADAHREMTEKHSFAHQRYEDVLAQNHVLTSQLKTLQKERDALQINLSQREVDLAKQDNQLAQLKDENVSLKSQLATLQDKKQAKESAQLASLQQQLTELTQSVAEIRLKDRDKK